MRLIRKDYTTSTVIRHKKELQDYKLDEESLLDPNVYPGCSGRKLWSMVRDIKKVPHLWDLKHQMYDEQGGICCYCGLRIFKDKEGRQQSVEHLIPKSAHRELVGEYGNLLLSCSVIDDDAAIMMVESTKDASLKHCDDSKADTNLNYTPLMPECESVFMYDAVGSVNATNQQAQTDIDTLQLNCDLLRRRRKAALSILFDDEGKFLDDEDLKQISSKIMSRDKENRLPEFCFVIKKAIDYILDATHQ